MPRKPRQVFQVIFGTSLIGVGISLNYLANLGLGPWGVFHDGLSKTIGITYGRTIIVTGVAVMLLWIPLKQKPGLGTLIDCLLYTSPTHETSLQIVCRLLLEKK